MIEAVNALTLLVSGVERTNLTYNHPLSSYKVDRIIRKRFKRVETPNGSSGRKIPLRVAYGHQVSGNTSSESYDRVDLF